MFRSVLPTQQRALVRKASSLAVSTKEAELKPVATSQASSGIKLASQAFPNGNYKGMSRIVAAFKAGSRYEKSPDQFGMSHLLRRSAGLSTKNLTQVNLVRHLNQMGAALRCTSTREHLIYSIDAPTCFARVAGDFFRMAVTENAYLSWELKENSYKLMEYDIASVNRRQLDILVMEMLHEAAFGRNPLGTGLGNSLYAPSSMLSWYTSESIESYISKHCGPANMSMAIVGHPDGEDVLNGMVKLLDFTEAPTDYTPATKPAHGKEHVFVGGQLLLSNHLAGSNHVALAWHTAGLTNHQEDLALQIASKALTGSLGRVPYYVGTAATDGTGGLNAQLPCGTVDGKGNTQTSLAAGFHRAYSDAGLFGFVAVASCPRLLTHRAVGCMGAMKKALTDDEVARGKAMLQMDIYQENENSLNAADYLAVQSLISDQAPKSISDRIQEIDGVTTAAVNSAIKKVIDSSSAAMAVVGTDAHQMPNLKELLTI